MSIRTARLRSRQFVYRSRLLRFIVWRTSQLVGRLRQGLFSGRRKLLALLVFDELTLLAVLLFTVGLHDLRWSDLRWVLAVFLGWFVQVFLLLLVRARSRVVVEQFQDSTGTEQKPDSRGLATLLVGELADFRNLYSTVDERAIPTAVQKSRPLAATIKVQDLSDFLESPAMIEAKASVGPVKVPIGAMFAFLGRLVRGPRLFGGVHVEGDRLVLAVQLSHQDELRTWRVDAPLPPNTPEQRREVPHEMITELACRMFTDLALGGPVRWQATRDFAKALRSIRECLRTPENRRRNLQNAERALIQALREDDQLGYVFYNLGVVFTELRRLAESEGTYGEETARAEAEAHAHWNASERAFSKQIALMPDRWEAYYALALTYRTRRPTPQWDYVLKRCDRVASMKPGRATTAKVLLVKSDANDDRDEIELMIKHRREAVAEAWSALCHTERTGTRDYDTAAHLAASALRGLGVAYCDSRRQLGRFHSWYAHRRGRALLGRAVKLAPHDADIRFELGLAWESNPKRAIKDIDEALRIDPARPFSWAKLALLHAQRARPSYRTDGETRHAKYCCEQALRLVDCHATDGSVDEILETIASAYKKLGETRRAAAAREMRGVADLCRSTTPNVATLQNLVASYGNEWAGAQARAALGRIDFQKKRYRQAAEKFKLAIEVLEDRHSEEIVRRQLRIRYAEALQKLGRHDEALEELRRAIGDDPLHSRPREALADAYCEIHDYEHAQQVLLHGLLWDPDRPTLHRKLGHCQWKLAQDRPTADRRKQMLESAVESFSNALKLSEHHELKAQCTAHYWLARLYKELGDYDQAIPHLRRAAICLQAEPLVYLLLGEAYVHARTYEAGENALRLAIEGATRKLAKVDYGKHVEDPGWNQIRVRAYAHALLARSYAERGVRGKAADDEVMAAETELKQVGRERQATEAACADAAGLVAVVAERLDDAIPLFERALVALPQSETYAHLGRAYLLKSERDPVDALRYIRLGEEACRKAIEFDVTDRYSEEARAILADLDRAKSRIETTRVPAYDGRGTPLEPLMQQVGDATADGNEETASAGETKLPARDEDG